VRELRKCVEEAKTPESEALKQMRRENQHLRKQLVELQSKLTALAETIKVMAGSVSNVLDKCSSEGSSDEAVDIVSSSEPSGNEPEGHIFNSELDTSAVYCSVGAAEDPGMPFVEPFATISHPAQFFQNPGHLETPCDGAGWDAISSDSSFLLLPQIPNIWSHEYQMGLQPYMRALSSSQSTSLILGKAWVETNSPFSDHISTLRHLLRTKIGQIGPQVKQYEMYFRPR
jgi:threonine aldolase